MSVGCMMKEKPMPHAFIQRGIDEGLFLPNLNYNIVRTMTVALQNAIMNQYLYKKYDIKELAHVSILFFYTRLLHNERR